ncbi:hypothetical protein ACQKNC_15930 [Lysinibacillus sp. NPDC094177]|uniref:hypothetical protein n=1 Tax=Lysinibacillus sp. NPDC094177 TaxID=3390580 RepID=UPI003D04AFF7
MENDQVGKQQSEQMSAKEILNAIDNMDNGERIDLLSLMYDKYYDINKNLGVKDEDFRLEAAYIINKVNQLEKDLIEIKLKFIAK